MGEKEKHPLSSNSTSGYRIRLMESSDISAVEAINLTSWPGYTTSELLEKRYGQIEGRPWQERITNDVLTHIQRDDVTTFVAEVDDEVIGYAAAQIETEPSPSEIGIVSYNAVSPDHRGMGIGSALVQQVMDYLEEQGARILLVWTLEVGETARHIYESHGFEELTRFVYYSKEVKD
ncbi:MAG: GNAT family N-acetyltransferase [Anaerolineales bacterium]|nr:GNAT family N-acetyltransferase [Anaerolineales bacterium]